MSRDSDCKLKLMVVDDEPDNLDLLYRTFRRNFKVYKADSGPNALATLEQEGEMAIIISDQRMPRMNGTEFLSRTVEAYPDTIRIVLTGYTDVEDLVEAINSGKVFKYITKPWSPEELKNVVHQAGETYRVLKQRTNELNRALRRESLFNAVISAIRESLDYHSMLQTVVNTLGQTFEAEQAILFPIDAPRLTDKAFFYPGSTTEDVLQQTRSELTETLATFLSQSADQSKQIHILAQDSSEANAKLAVLIADQQEWLALLDLQRPSGQDWSDEDVNLIREVAEQAALAISQAKLYQTIQIQTQQMQAELEVARQIQSNLLHQSWPEFEQIKVQACCHPARAVGGDFFEVYPHSQEDIWLAVGDVSGKGVPAALFMASALSVLRRELSQEVSPEPDIVMRNLNQGLSNDLISNNCFITMVLARYRPSQQQLVYANAGHIYPMVWPHQKLKAQPPAERKTIEPTYLKERGVPLGILPVWQAKSGTISMSPGDVVLLTSDGITEATVDGHQNHSASGMLQQEGLWQIILQHPDALNLDKLLSIIQSNTSMQEDDQTILSLEVL
ncbi:MAG: SpoIIE family protein phosphatase [Thainema sp.]